MKRSKKAFLMITISALALAAGSCAKETAEPVAEPDPQVEEKAQVVIETGIGTALPDKKAAEPAVGTVSVVHTEKKETEGTPAVTGTEKTEPVVEAKKEVDYSYATWLSNYNRIVTYDNFGAVYFVDSDNMPRRPLYWQMTDEELTAFNEEALATAIDTFNLGYIDRENSVFVSGFGMKQDKEGRWSQAVPYINGTELPDLMDEVIHSRFENIPNLNELPTSTVALLMAQSHEAIGCIYEPSEEGRALVLWYGNINWKTDSEGRWYRREWTDSYTLPTWEVVYTPEDN